MGEKNGIVVFAIAAVVAIGTASVTRPSAGEPRPARGLFAPLRVGQAVTLKDLGTAYEIGTLDEEVPTGYVISELGDQYLAVRDVTGVTEVRIPAYSIKAVVRVRVRAK